MLTPIRVFSSDDINVLNKAMWEYIHLKGQDITFGSKEEPKKAREIFAVVQIYGKALNDLYAGKLPKGWKFKGNNQKVYIEMLKNPDKGDQDYTYGQRLADQWEAVKEALKESIQSGIQSNRIVGMLWWDGDIKSKNPPCFNWFQLRTSEKNKVSLRVLFRSHDYINANFANWGAIIKAFQDLVIVPAGGVLEELICASVSAHLYDNEMDTVFNLIGGKS